MRYSEIDLQCEDIMWFGVDKNGYIFECTSGGCGSVPEFVCCSKENTDTLYDFFIDELQDSLSTPNLLISLNEAPIVEDCTLLASKGIYCFDTAIAEGKADEYKKIAYPSKPLLLADLPQKIQSVLEHHRVESDVQISDYIKVKHAY